VGELLQTKSMTELQKEAESKAQAEQLLMHAQAVLEEKERERR